MYIQSRFYIGIPNKFSNLNTYCVQQQKKKIIKKNTELKFKLSAQVLKIKPV